MATKAHVGPRALHPLVVLIPTAGVLLSLLFDLAWLATGDAAWWLPTRPILPITFLGAVAAIMVGLFDLIEVVPAGRATRTAAWHTAAQLALVIVLALDTHARWTATFPLQGAPGFALGLLAAALVVASGWLDQVVARQSYVDKLEARYPRIRDPRAPAH